MDWRKDNNKLVRLYSGIRSSNYELCGSNLHYAVTTATLIKLTQACQNDYGQTAGVVTPMSLRSFDHNMVTILYLETPSSLSMSSTTNTKNKARKIHTRVHSNAVCNQSKHPQIQRTFKNSVEIPRSYF